MAKMLYEQTDEDHYLTIVQIMEQLDKDYGISTSRGTVGDDIKALQELGVEIAVESSTQKRYYMIGRRFDLLELKTMIDPIESARFIPKEKSAGWRNAAIIPRPRNTAGSTMPLYRISPSSTSWRDPTRRCGKRSSKPCASRIIPCG